MTQHANHIARHFRFERREVVANTSAAAAPAHTGVTYAENIVNEAVPQSTRILAAIAGILTLAIILGGVVWKLKARKQRQQALIPVSKRTTESITEKDKYGALDKPSTHSFTWEKGFEGSLVEKPKPAYGTETTDNQVGWAPQIKNFRGVPVSGKQFEKNMTSPGSLAKWEKKMTAVAHAEPASPPPSYTLPALTVSPAAPVPTPAPAQRTPPPVATPKNLSLIVPPNLRDPIPSPTRTSSFAHQQAPFLFNAAPVRPLPSPSITIDESQFDLPRLMKVSDVFIPNPTMSDELSVKIGETLLLVEEYQDGWCLVQRMLRADFCERGVVPRSCLGEKPKDKTFARNLTANRI